MGWMFRKSFSLGPLRVNLSKSGIGFSFGVRGLRAGMSSTGRKYVSASVPGTGVRYHKSTKSLSTLWGKDKQTPAKNKSRRRTKKESFW